MTLSLTFFVCVCIGLTSACPNSPSFLKDVAIFCQRGQYVKVLGPNIQTCYPCREGTFMPDQFHQRTSCKECQTPNEIIHEVEVKPCTRERDTVIACKKGYYRSVTDQVTEKHTCNTCRSCDTTFPARECAGYKNTVCCNDKDMDVEELEDGKPVCVQKPPGLKQNEEGIQRKDSCAKGEYVRYNITSLSLLICQPCPEGSFMDETSNRNYACKPCTHLDGRELVRPCSRIQDALFGNGDFHDIECGMGQKVKVHVSGAQSCVPCPENTFMDLAKHRERSCQACSVADKQVFEVQKAKCTRFTDTLIHCLEGYYRFHYEDGSRRGRCNVCTECEYMQNKYESRRCDTYQDTACCPNADMDVEENDAGIVRCRPKLRNATVDLSETTRLARRFKNCGQGEYLVAYIVKNSTAECHPCEWGSFMEERQHLNDRCKPCTIKVGWILIRACSMTEDANFRNSEYPQIGASSGYRVQGNVRSFHVFIAIAAISHIIPLPSSSTLHSLPTTLLCLCLQLSGTLFRQALGTLTRESCSREI